jgi:hypothetical protein
VSPTRQRQASLDEICAQAVDLARSAAAEIAGPDRVGPHAGVQAEGDRIATHLFACLEPAYAGWQWAVTVSRASRARVATVSEAVLLPGPGSLLAPAWVPWSSRVRPGDLGVGDLLPADSDDERLVPVVALEGDDGMLDWDGGTDPAAAGSGLTVPAGLPRRASLAVAGLAAGATADRSRTLSAIGRDEAALRWYASEHGPGTPLASAAPGPCLSCGFLVRLSGPLGRIFGVCANEFAPDDGRVVSLDHGCGGHSDAIARPGGHGAGVPAVDEVGFDLVDAPGVSMADTEFESLDHGTS